MSDRVLRFHKRTIELNNLEFQPDGNGWGFFNFKLHNPVLFIDYQVIEEATDELFKNFLEYAKLQIEIYRSGSYGSVSHHGSAYPE